MTIEVEAPNDLRGDQLTAELAAAGIAVVETRKVDDVLVILGADEQDRATVESVVTAHVPDFTEQVNDATLRQQAHDSLITLRTSIDTLKAITDKTNANIGPADTKAVARELRRTQRQVLALTRLLIGALDSADTGTD